MLSLAQWFTPDITELTPEFLGQPGLHETLPQKNRKV